MRRKRGKRHINWFAVLLSVIILYFASIIVEQQMYLRAVADDRQAAEARLSAAQQENEALKREKEQLGDPACIERIAREELGMTRHGELPYSSSGVAAAQKKQ